MSKDPVRWADGGAPPGLGDLLQQAQGDTPSRNELRVLGTMIAPLAGGLAVGSGVGAGSAAAGAGTAAAAGSNLSSGVGVAGASQAGAAVGAKAATAGGLSVAAKVIGVGAIVATGSAGLWMLQTEPEPPRAVTPIEAPAQVVESAPVAPALEPKSEPEPEAAGVESEGADVLAERERLRPVEKKAPRPASVKQPVQSTELGLLGPARQALKNNPRRALSLAKQHERQYPRGQLAQEREVIMIEALKRLGQKDQATSRGKQFEEQFPESAHQKKVHDSLEPEPGSN